MSDKGIKLSSLMGAVVNLRKRVDQLERGGCGGAERSEGQEAIPNEDGSLKSEAAKGVRE